MFHVEMCVAARLVSVGAWCRCRFPGLVPGKRVCGPSRLPDVKPPCSNLAGTLVPANFLSEAVSAALLLIDLRASPASRNACKPKGIEAKLGISVEQSGRAMPHRGRVADRVKGRTI